MDWLFGWFDRLVQSAVLRSIVNHISWVDCLTFAFVFIGLLYGAKKGLLRVLVELVEAVLVGVIVLTYYQTVGSTIGSAIKFISPKAYDVIGYLILSIPVWVVVLYADSIMRKWFHTKVVSPIRVVGGALLGGCYALFLWSFISQAIVMTNFHFFTRGYQSGKSLTGPRVIYIVPTVYNLIASR